jgi:hypothetical protein
MAIRSEMSEASGFAIQAVQGYAPCTNPEVSPVVFQERQSPIITDSFRIMRVMGIMHYIACTGIKAFNPIAGAEPKQALVILVKRKDVFIATQTWITKGIPGTAGKRSALPIEKG